MRGWCWGDPWLKDRTPTARQVQSGDYLGGMRRALFAFALVVLAAPAAAEPVTEATIFAISQMSCRGLVSAFHLKDFHRVAAPSIDEFVQRRDGFKTVHNSVCNIMELARAECILNPGGSVGDALESLLSKDRKGLPLPQGRRCGA